MKKENLFVRNLDADIYLESFLVAAVASVLIIRLFLRLTDYPQIGGGGLHIAHMLWGGALMLASIIILISFLNRVATLTASVVGGIGFGAFIDEVGKFVTSDNNYFFRPAVSLIYIAFILIFLAMRAIHARRIYSDEEYLANALREMQEVAIHDLNEAERRRALLYLEKSDAANELTLALKHSLLAQTDLRPMRNTLSLSRLKKLVADFYTYVAIFRWFTFGVIAFFIAQLIVKLIYVFILIFFVGLRWSQILDWRIIGRIAAQMQELSFVDWADIAFWLLSGLFVLGGITRIRRSRLFAYRMFERSILVSIFLSQVFAFYKEQFSALLGLVFNVAVLIALRFMIEREKIQALKKS
jgi:hypothetical protein